MTTASTAEDQSQGAAAAAAEEGKHLGGAAAQEAQNVAGDVKEQARSFLDDTRQQLAEQSSVQRDRLVELLRGLSHDLRDMADQASSGSGLAHQLVRQGADRAERIGSRLDRREPTDLLEDVRTFARRKPGTFLAGALVAGVVAGRFARGVKDSDGSAASIDASETPAVAGQAPVPQPVTGPIDAPGVPVTPAADGGTTSYQTASTGGHASHDPFADAP
jgi:hypothetical protein